MAFTLLLQTEYMAQLMNMKFDPYILGCVIPPP